MFERFTDRARRVVVLAQEEARDLGHSYIGTEHLLLGLCHEGAGVAVAALEALGVSLAAVRTQVEEIVGRGEHPRSGHIPFTPRAKKVLELSLRESQQLEHGYIGTEHLLLGLIREGQGVAARVLGDLGVDLGRARQQVIELLGVGPGSAVAGGGAAVRIGGSQGQLEELLSRLSAIDARLAAIEQHLGMAGPPGGPGEPAAASRPGKITRGRGCCLGVIRSNHPVPEGSAMPDHLSAAGSPVVGVLALQGDVAEHFRALSAAGARPVRVRLPGELDAVDGLIIPGGELTTIWKLAVTFELMDPLRKRIAAGNAGVRVLRRHDHAGGPGGGRHQRPADVRRDRHDGAPQRVRPAGGLVRGGHPAGRRAGACRCAPFSSAPRGSRRPAGTSRFSAPTGAPVGSSRSARGPRWPPRSTPS